MAQIGTLIANAAYLEVQLAELMVQAAGPQSVDLVKALHDSVYGPAREKLLQSTVLNCLNARQGKLFRAIYGFAEQAIQIRHKFAHHIYCEAPGAENYILLIDPAVWLDHVSKNFDGMKMQNGDIQPIARTADRIPNTLNDKIVALSYWEIIDYDYALGEAIKLMGDFHYGLGFTTPTILESMEQIPVIAKRLAELNKKQKAKKATGTWPRPEFAR